MLEKSAPAVREVDDEVVVLVSWSIVIIKNMLLLPVMNMIS
jgi:hypothetical protein